MQICFRGYPGSVVEKEGGAALALEFPSLIFQYLLDVHSQILWLRGCWPWLDGLTYHATCEMKNDERPTPAKISENLSVVTIFLPSGTSKFVDDND